MTYALMHVEWAEAYTVVGHKVLDACANAHGAGARADVLQAVQEFGALARTVFAYRRSRRSGAAAAARATRIADGLPLSSSPPASSSGRLHGLSVVCIRNAPSTGQRVRCRTASPRMRGIRECVLAGMQLTRLLLRLPRWRPRSRRCS